MAGVLDGQPVDQDDTNAGFLPAVVEATNDLAMGSGQQLAVYNGTIDATFTLPLLSSALNTIRGNPFSSAFIVVNLTSFLLTLQTSGSDTILNPFPPTGPASSIQFRSAALSLYPTPSGWVVT